MLATSIDGDARYMLEGNVVAGSIHSGGHVMQWNCLHYMAENGNSEKGYAECYTRRRFAEFS